MGQVHSGREIAPRHTERSKAAHRAAREAAAPLDRRFFSLRISRSPASSTGGISPVNSGPISLDLSGEVRALGRAEFEDNKSVLLIDGVYALTFPRRAGWLR